MSVAIHCDFLNIFASIDSKNPLWILLTENPVSFVYFMVEVKSLEI